MFVITLLAVKGEEYETEHVEGSEERGEQAEAVENVAAVFVVESAEQDGVLTEECGQGREASDGQCGDEHGPVRPLNFFAEAAHFQHVLLAAHGVNNAAGGKEEQRFEESVSH